MAAADRARIAAFLGSFLLAALPAQVPAGPEQEPPAQAQDAGAQSLVTIAGLVKAIDAIRVEVRARRAEAAAQQTEARRLELLAEADALQKGIAERQRTLELVATGIDLDSYGASPDETGLATELEKLLRPLLKELREITAEPRQIDQLETDRDATSLRLAAVAQGIERVQRLREQTTDPAIVAALDAVRAAWTREQERIAGDLQVIQFRLGEKERARRSFLETAQAVIGGFFRERGLNLLLALAAFATVLFGLGWLYRAFTRRVPRERRHRFAVRLLAVAFHLLVGSLAVAAALIVLYAAEDWVLLGLAGLFLLGLIWAGKQTLPRFYQEARLLLNLGDAREQERVILEGLPWRIDRLHLQSRLVNPALTGGVLRLPLRDLIGMRSRPSTDREPWFPCFEGDWVLVDGACGRVLVQTPQTVEILVLGARRSMPTSAFLAANPTNLTGGFGFRSTFGIDYRHQAIATTRVPAVMAQTLQARLPSAPGGDGLTALKVELDSAGTSSLDYAVVAEFKGSSAQYYFALQRAVQRILVEVCNAEQWTIPFPQLTMHQADQKGSPTLK